MWRNVSHSVRLPGLPSRAQEWHRDTWVAAGAQRHREKSIIWGLLKSALLPVSLLETSVLVLPQYTAALCLQL